jgi:bacillithiol biosynthesis deacetylase BshB1
MMSKPVDILAFSPHPDDAELGCGGSLILAADRGLQVAIADLSAGEMSSRGTPPQRQREKEHAAEILGLCARPLVGLPDSKIGTDPGHRLPIIQLIRDMRPRIVLAPYGEDRHPDHGAASKMVRDACFLAGVSKIGTGQPHRPERLYYYMIHHPFAPSFVVDISTVWDRKMAAIAAYQGQFQSDGSGLETAISRPHFLRFLEARAIWAGAMAGVEYGEAFFMPGPLPLGELPGATGTSLPPGKLPAYSMYL